MPKSWTFKFKSKLFQRNKRAMTQKKHYGKTWFPNKKQKLYELLLEACFDSSNATSMVEEVDDHMEHVKKTWVILGINQMFHNLCFMWLLFSRYVVNGQVDMDLIYTCDSQLVELAQDAKTPKDPEHSQVLSATLSVILGWAEKRLLAYLDTFDRPNVVTMVGIVSLSVSAARILVEVISIEYRRRRKGEVDVARTRIETYIRSSLRTVKRTSEHQSRQARKEKKQRAPLTHWLLLVLAHHLANERGCLLIHITSHVLQVLIQQKQKWKKCYKSRMFKYKSQCDAAIWF